jgi:3-deoxy-D-manno-octulosonic-acid transferase
LPRRLIRFLYRAVQFLAFPLIVLYLCGRGLRERRYWVGVGERFGRLPRSYRQTGPGAIWLHAVSVGEVVASVRLIRELRGRFPKIFVSTTTLAGRAVAEERLRGLADGVFYAPIDYTFAVRAALRALRPSLVLIVETEIWPNLWREARRSGAALAVVNARISDRAMPRYRRMRWFFRHALADADAILAQDEAARRRYLELGAPPERVSVGGNLKYDFDAAGTSAPEAVAGFIEETQPAAVWIAASTMPPAGAGDVDEDDAVLDAFERLSRDHPGLLLLLVPRRPERFDEAARKLTSRGIAHVRRSRLPARLALPGVLLVDSMGELASLFGLAGVVFLGGTLARRGGHNLLEPAFCARPVIIGPHMENFSEIAADFRAAGAVVEIGGPGELAPAAGALIRDEARRRELGGKARELAGSRRGATSRAVEAAARLRDAAMPRRMLPVPLHAAAWAGARLWGAGVAIERRRQLASRRRLNAPVISIGGIAMGGAGKTPLVARLARDLSAAGFRVAILTRGYGRRAREPLVLRPGSNPSVEAAGDEAPILLASGAAVVGVAAGRYEIGRAIGDAADVFLLDDGFQHWRLHRDFDIVAVDALDPFAGGDLFPLGRLREPPSALARAGAIVVTHAEAARHYSALEERIRRENPAAPVFYARTVAREWRDAATGQVVDPAGRAVAAFCGLGNPASFWRTIAPLEPRFEVAFPDHHRYSAAEIEALARRARALGCQALLTTEKDFANLPDAKAHLPVWRLAIDVEVEGLVALLTPVVSRIVNAAAGR